MTAPRLSDLGEPWAELADSTADWSADLLRRTAAAMGDALDQQAQRDIEGAREWRDLTIKEGRYASAGS